MAEEQNEEREETQRDRYNANLEKARAFLAATQPDIEYDERGRIVSDPESLTRYAERLRQAGFWVSVVAKLTGLRPSAQPRGDEDEQLLRDIEGPVTKAAGYKEEFKELIRKQVGRSRELTEFCTDMGLGILLASLGKAEISVEGFRKIALKGEGLRESLEEAGETAFKALEAFESDAFNKLEEERDYARAYSSYLAAQWEELSKQLDPKFRLEKMIYTLALSGNVDYDVIMGFMEKWLVLEAGEMKLELMR